MTDNHEAAAKRAGFVEALLRERAQLVARGKTERVRQVDEQIKAYGGQPPVDRRSPRAAQNEA